MIFLLNRVYVGEEGAFGTIGLQDKPPFAVTLERTFENNRVVIPKGTHQCIRSVYYKGGYPTYEIMVDGHSRVLFHKGNKEEHSLGCILVAEYFHDFDEEPGIANSAGGFNEFMSLAGNIKEFNLIVV